MSRPRVKPEFKDEGGVLGKTETHPAYAMIGASRVSSSPGRELFGSDFLHQHYMTVSIHRAQMRRDLSNDWPSAREEIIEVALSEAQWATFVSTANVGFGTPCTILYEEGKGYAPGIEGEAGRDRKKYEAEVEEHVTKAIENLDEIIAAAPTKKMREFAERAKGQLLDGLPWVAKQYDEHMEKAVEKAKIEVNAYVTQMIQRAGLEALGAGDSPLLQLRTENESPEE